MCSGYDSNAQYHTTQPLIVERAGATFLFDGKRSGAAFLFDVKRAGAASLLNIKRAGADFLFEVKSTLLGVYRQRNRGGRKTL